MDYSVGNYKSYNDYVVRNGLSKSIDNAIDYLFDVDTEMTMAAKYVEIMLNDINTGYMESGDSRIEYWKLGYEIIKESLDVY